MGKKKDMSFGIEFGKIKRKLKKFLSLRIAWKRAQRRPDFNAMG